MGMTKVLVVDDDPTINEMVCDIMRLEGHEVISAKDGLEGLKMAAEHPDLIILDVEMPGLNGFQLCTKLRSQPELNQTRLVMLTGRQGESDIDRGIHSGADAYLTKPFSAADLVARIRLFLGPAPEPA